MQGLIVRPATSQDSAALAVILNAIIRAGGTTALENEFSDAMFCEEFVDGPHVICSHVAVERSTGQLTGFQTLSKGLNRPDDRTDIATFARLEPKIPGVGRSLFAATKETAKARGITAIVAEIRADNRGGLAYYERMGFRTFEMLRAVPLLDGTPTDRIIKRFDLL